jgi:hypothetical protein
MKMRASLVLCKASGHFNMIQVQACSIAGAFCGRKHTVLSAEPVASTYSLKGLNARQLTSAWCASPACTIPADDDVISWLIAAHDVEGTWAASGWPECDGVQGERIALKHVTRCKRRVQGLCFYIALLVSRTGGARLTARHGLPCVPHNELLVVAHAAKHVLMLAVPCHVLWEQHAWDDQLDNIE